MPVLIIAFGTLIDWLDPTIINLNLLPVKANGEVLFLSVLYKGILGNETTPNAIDGGLY